MHWQRLAGLAQPCAWALCGRAGERAKPLSFWFMRWGCHLLLGINCGLKQKVLLALSATFCAFAFGQDVLPVPALSGRVIDQTATLTALQVTELAAKLEAFESQHGTQIVVLMVPATAPEDIAAYGQRVADTWKIGRRDIGDGLVVIVAKNDRTVRIEVAKALEGAVPDAAAGRIINGVVVPAFKAGDFAGGLNGAVDQLMARIANEGLAAPAEPKQRRASGRGFDIQDIAIFLFVGVPILGGLLTGMLAKSWVRSPPALR